METARGCPQVAADATDLNDERRETGREHEATGPPAETASASAPEAAAEPIDAGASARHDVARVPARTMTRATPREPRYYARPPSDPSPTSPSSLR